MCIFQVESRTLCYPGFYLNMAIMWSKIVKCGVFCIKVGITVFDNQFNNILAHKCDPSLKVSSDVPAFCTTFYFNQTINKHFSGTFVNICYFMLGCLILKVCIVKPAMILAMIKVCVFYKMQCSSLIFHVFTKSTCKMIIYRLIFNFKLVQKVYKVLYMTIDTYRYIAIFG